MLCIKKMNCGAKALAALYCVFLPESLPPHKRAPKLVPRHLNPIGGNFYANIFTPSELFIKRFNNPGKLAVIGVYVCVDVWVDGYG